MCFTGFILFVKNTYDKNLVTSNLKENFTDFERKEESLRLMEEGGEKDGIWIRAACYTGGSWSDTFPYWNGWGYFLHILKMSKMLWTWCYFNGDISAAEQSVSVKMNKDNQGEFLMFSDAIKEDGTLLEFKGIPISRDEQYVVETTQFEDYNGKAKIYLNYYVNPIGKNIELNIPLQ